MMSTLLIYFLLLINNLIVLISNESANSHPYNTAAIRIDRGIRSKTL